MADPDSIPWPSGKVTFLYTDIEKSTKAAAEMHDAAYDAQVKRPHYERLRENIEAQRGRAFNDKGDGVVAVFWTAQEAVAATVALQRSFRDSPLLRPDGSPVRVRMGLHTSINELNLPGSASHVLFDGFPDYGSEDLNFASRIEFLASGGQVLLSQTARNAYCGTHGGEISLHEWLGRRLKDFAVAESVFDLLYDGREALNPGSRFLPAFYKGERNRYVTREDKEAEVFAALANNKTRIVTLRAAGGAGKTRLAVACAVKMATLFPQGVFFVSLAVDPAALVNPTPEIVAERVAEAVGLPPDARDPKSVAEYLRVRETLLLLDNAESLSSDDINLWLGRLVGEERCRLLITSRVLAGPTDCTQDIDLNDGMTEDEARTLFLETVRRRAPQWAIPMGQEAAMTRILSLTDRLPLALELAASWADRRTLTDIADGLSNVSLEKYRERPRKQVYSTDAETFARHISLERCLDWSWNLLDDESRQTLAVSSLFAAPFVGEVLDAIAERPTENDRDRLLDNSLVQFGTTTGRYRLHNSTRAYAAEHLNNAAEHLNTGSDADTAEHLNINPDTIRRRFVQLYAALVEANQNPNDAASIAFLDGEWRNARHASDLVETLAEWPAALSLSMLYDFLLPRGFWRDAEAITRRAVTASENLRNRQARGAASNNLGIVYRTQGKYKEAEQAYNADLAICREFGDRVGEGKTLGNLGILMLQQGKQLEGCRFLAQAAAVLTQTEDQMTLAHIQELQAEYCAS